jgi:HEAT repeat protein
MHGDAGTSGDDLDGLVHAIQDRAESLGGDQAELAREWRRRVTDQQNAGEESWTKIIQAVRELLSFIPMPAVNESPLATISINWEQAQSSAVAASESGDQRTRPVLRELTDGPNGLTQLQSLLMVAGLVRALSQESGRQEEEIIEELAANLQRPAG